MKTLISFLAAAMLIATAQVHADDQEPVSLDFFYDNLEPYGIWREVGDYGYCWQPRDVEEGWRPYSDGRWVYTDAGWTWDSDEPYSWAVYHYGRWANVESVGWVWVPGTEWGPGWVSWRHSPRYVGWAPLPPEASFRVGIGLSAWVDDYYDIGPSSYCFVEGHNFGSRRLNTVFIDQRENMSIIHQTTNITNITYVNNVVHNGGLRYDQQFRQSADPIPRYTLDRRQSFDGNDRHPSADHLRSRVAGGALSVFAAPFGSRFSAAPRKVSQRIDHAEIDHGWSKAGSPAEINEMREKLRSKVRTPDDLPPRAKSDRTTPKDEPFVRDRIPSRRDGEPKGNDNREGKARMQESPPNRPPEKLIEKERRAPLPKEAPPAPRRPATSDKKPTPSDTPRDRDSSRAKMPESPRPPTRESPPEPPTRQQQPDTSKPKQAPAMSPKSPTEPKSNARPAAPKHEEAARAPTRHPEPSRNEVKSPQPKPSPSAPAPAPKRRESAKPEPKVKASPPVKAQQQQAPPATKTKEKPATKGKKKSEEEERRK